MIRAPMAATDNTNRNQRKAPLSTGLNFYPLYLSVLMSPSLIFSIYTCVNLKRWWVYCFTSLPQPPIQGLAGTALKNSTQDLMERVLISNIPTTFLNIRVAKKQYFRLECTLIMQQLRFTLLIIIALVAAFNLGQTSLIALQHSQDRTTVPLHSLGAQFEGLKDVFNGVRYAGYYTDKNLDIPLAVAQFEQAQYALAPTVLMLNKTDYPLVILDCTSPDIAIAKGKELGLIPLKAANGIILASNPKATQP